MVTTRRWLKRAASILLGAFVRVTSSVVGLAARRGIGSEHQLQSGFLAVPLHYYQPVFDSSAVPSAVWDREHDMPGIDFSPDRQLALLSELGRFGSECRWPRRSENGYFTSNSSFGYSSGALLHAMIRHFSPQRVVEIGAGMSTVLIAGALEGNERRGLLTTIDPNPREQLHYLPDRFEIVRVPVQDCPLETFEGLQRNDVLFIDSSHVVKTGGDVNFLYLDVLPRLNPGVIVHVHDIQLPYEYFRSYSDNRDGPRIFWTEQYLLQALLSQSPAWEILLAGYWIQRNQAKAFGQAFPHWDPAEHRVTTSFYIRATGSQ